MVRKKLKALKARIGGDNLGPDRGTTDQLEARKERARMEGKREAKRERVSEQVEQARKQGRRRGKGIKKLLSDGIEQATEQFEDVGGDLNTIDVDDDGVGLGDELEDAPAGLAMQVDENTEDITELEQQFEGQVFDDSGDERQGGGDGAVFTTDPLFESTAPFETDDDDDGGGLF